MSGASAESELSDGDGCQRAVRRAYRELLNRGEPDRFAFEAALAVYHWHHPEVAPERALDIVFTWLWDGVRH